MMCDHENREAAMLRIAGTPVEGVTTKVGYCDPCLLPVVQALNDGGLTTLASCCGHGHRPGSVALADGRWLHVATQAQTDVIDAAFPVDNCGDLIADRVHHLSACAADCTETHRQPCTICNGTGIKVTLPIGGLEQRSLCPRCHGLEAAGAEMWECGPHTNAWNGHDARCRRVPATTEEGA